MTRLNTTEHYFNMNWDEYVIAVEDSYLIEADADLTDAQYAQLSSAFDSGMSPVQCAIALMESRSPNRPAANWRMAA